jgi:hypothetical protein
MKNLTKNIIAFSCVFLFIQVCGAYIMGGFDHQTIISKGISISMGITFGALFAGALEDFSEKE